MTGAAGAEALGKAATGKAATGWGVSTGLAGLATTTAGLAIATTGSIGWGAQTDLTGLGVALGWVMHFMQTSQLQTRHPRMAAFMGWASAHTSHEKLPEVVRKDTRGQEPGQEGA